MIDWRFLQKKILSGHPSARAIVGLCASLLLSPALSHDADHGLNATSADTGNMSFPERDLFTPLIAATRQPQFFISFINIDSDTDDFLSASVGFGYTFGLYRWQAETPGNGWQLNFYGAAFSQFNMDASSDDLINTDYQVGFPLSYRHDAFSARFRLFHQSSHLGDELLLGPQPPERVNLSIEAVDAVFSYEWQRWRGYAGLGYIVRHDPDDLESGAVQFGVEFRYPTGFIGTNQFLGGIDLEMFEETDWDGSTSLKAGLAWGNQPRGGNGIRLMAEFYDGPAPFGQFYTFNVTYYGAGIYYDF